MIEIRWSDSDTTDGVMKELQKTQNKLLHFLNKSSLKDKIKTKVILQNINMLSVNQINAQIKLTKAWMAFNNKNSSLIKLKKRQEMVTGSQGPLQMVTLLKKVPQLWPGVVT